ncbi:hypothetical protein ACA910_003431, partial [Epithemia clementina (nom. ined.)]
MAPMNKIAGLHPWLLLVLLWQLYNPIENVAAIQNDQHNHYQQIQHSDYNDNHYFNSHHDHRRFLRNGHHSSSATTPRPSIASVQKPSKPTTPTTTMTTGKPTLKPVRPTTTPKPSPITTSKPTPGGKPTTPIKTSQPTLKPVATHPTTPSPVNPPPTTPTTTTFTPVFSPTTPSPVYPLPTTPTTTTFTPVFSPTTPSPVYPPPTTPTTTTSMPVFSPTSPSPVYPPPSTPTTSTFTPVFSPTTPSPVYPPPTTPTTTTSMPVFSPTSPSPVYPPPSTPTTSTFTPVFSPTTPSPVYPSSPIAPTTLTFTPIFSPTTPSPVYPPPTSPTTSTFTPIFSPTTPSPSLPPFDGSTPAPYYDTTPAPTLLFTASPVSPTTFGPTFSSALSELDVSTPTTMDNVEAADRCLDAMWIASDWLPFQTEGTTATATPDFTTPTCEILPRSTGVWYKYLGTGRVTRVEYTTSYQAKLSILARSCSAFDCVVHGDNTVEWIAELNVTYYIYLGTYFATANGPFGLVVSDYDVPTNDQCDSAMDLATTVSSSSSPSNQTLPLEVSGSTVGALPDFAVGTTCGISAATAPGVWYTYIGTGTVTRLAVLATSFQAKVAIYRGSSCLVLQCEANGDTTVDWVAEAGVSFYLLVSGEDFKNVGSFDLVLSDFEAPVNDQCDSATLIASGLPFQTQGTTDGAKPDFATNTCNIDASARGVWYHFLGTGRVTRVDLTTPTFNGAISIFSGTSCTFLECEVNGNNLVEWVAELGVTYYILVTGKDFNSVGSFGLLVTDYDIPSNNECNSAIAIDAESLPLEVQDSTVGTTPDFDVLTCGLDPTSRGVWYSLVGSGLVTRVDYIASLYDGEVSIFRGSSCLVLECVVHGSDSRVEWVAMEGVTYYILLSGADFRSVGSFGLMVTQYQIPVNNECQSATTIPAGSLPFEAQGSSLGATPDFDAVTCGIVTTARGVWYTWFGNGNRMRVNYNAATAYDMELSVFEGSCLLLECVEHGDDTVE